MKNLISQLITRRLKIRMLDISDAKDLQHLLAENKQYMTPWIPWAGDEPQTVQEKKDQIRNWKGEFYLDKKYSYGIYSVKKEHLIGLVFLFTRQGKGILEIGYIIDQKEAGKGYATESSYAMTKLGFKHIAVDKMVIHCDSENQASIQIAKKLGYVLESTHKSAIKEKDGTRSETVILAQLVEDFKAFSEYEPITFEKEKGW